MSGFLASSARFGGMIFEKTILIIFIRGKNWKSLGKYKNMENYKEEKKRFVLTDNKVRCFFICCFSLEPKSHKTFFSQTETAKPKIRWRSRLIHRSKTKKPNLSQKALKRKNLEKILSNQQTSQKKKSKLIKPVQLSDRESEKWTQTRIVSK